MLVSVCVCVGGCVLFVSFVAVNQLPGPVGNVSCVVYVIFYGRSVILVLVSQ